MTRTTDMRARTDGPVDYSWSVSHTDAGGGTRVVKSGTGRFGSEDDFTGNTHRSYTAVGAAVFDDVCDDVIENHRYEVLDARIADEPDPVEVTAITVVVRDSGEVEMARLTGTLNHQPVTDDDVAEHLIELSLIEIEDERRRFQRSLDLEEETAVPLFELTGRDERSDNVLDDETRTYIDKLRESASDLRADVHEPDFCREQLARAEDDLTRGESSVTGISADLLRSRVDRWKQLLEISAEAYMDAAALDAAAEHARRSHARTTM